MAQANLQTSVQSFSLEAFSKSVTPSKASRRRGVVLTQQGLQKLMQSNALCDRYGNRYSYEVLAGFAQLDPRTISRILSCETKIDKRTLKIFFNAFELQLQEEDYTIPETNSVPASTSIDELMQLKQRIVQDYNRLLNLINLEIQAS
ncbi:MAG: hypothetical protein ACAF41_28190 [Leptolyngbya sp. BL-A-14]